MRNQWLRGCFPTLHDVLYGGRPGDPAWSSAFLILYMYVGSCISTMAICMHEHSSNILTTCDHMQCTTSITRFLQMAGLQYIFAYMAGYGDY